MFNDIHTIIEQVHNLVSKLIPGSWVRAPHWALFIFSLYKKNILQHVAVTTFTKMKF